MNDSRIQVKEMIENHEPGIIGGEDVVETSVLIPMSGPENPNDSGLRIFFERRAQDLDIQPGDACFPGGFRDTHDETVRETARRETAEELGVEPHSIEIWGKFDTLVVPWEIRINTFVGWLKESGAIDPDSTEVDKIFSVGLNRVRRRGPEQHEVEILPAPGEDFPYDKIPGGRDYDWRPRRLPELFYEFDGEVIWGITARILHRFVETLEGDNAPAD